VVNEIASGVHDRHPKVRGLLIDTNVTRMVVAHQDRLSRFEPHHLESLFVA
jgi:predicted site-specific integrase-resolvase